MSKKVTSEKTDVVRMSEAGEELVKRLVVLYNSQVFVREGRNLREQLLLSGVEAGSNLASVDMIAERGAKIEVANNAVVQLNRTVYIANAMLMLGCYTTKQVDPLISYCSGLLSALKDLLRKVPEARRVIRVKTPVNVVSAAVEKDEYGAAAPVPEYEALAEPSGFEDYEGNTEGFDDPV